MKAKELLMECKIKAKIESDYALAKLLDIPRQRIADYMTGRMSPDSYAAVKIALYLKKDPAQVIAELEADSEKNDKKKGFWLDFLQHAKKAGKYGMLAAISTALWFSAPKPALADASHNVYYVK